MDVSSLYTSIPHDGGLEAIGHSIDTYPIDTEYKNFIQIVLPKNYFTFDGDYYLQIQGTAMGSNVAPSYANLFMDCSEKSFVYTYDDFESSVGLWLRYIDDIFFIWHGTESRLLQFRDYLNSQLPTISFTMEYSSSSVHFLDVQVAVTDTGLSFDVFRKETDRISFLHASSFHPKSLLDNLPYGQFLRLRRIIDCDENFSIRVRELTDNFVHRGYDLVNLEWCANRAKQKTRNELLTSHQRKYPSNRIPCVTTYSTQSNQVRHILNKYWFVLQADKKVGPLFQQPPLMAYKRSRNLRDQLTNNKRGAQVAPTSTSLSNWLVPPPGMHKCGRCVICNNVILTSYFNHPMRGTRFSVLEYLNCQHFFVIYLLKCPCGLCYVGETTRPLTIRIGEHKSAIRTGNQKSPIARHFNDLHHGVSQLRFLAIEHVPARTEGIDRIMLLKRRKLHWIYTLQTLSPLGLNEDLSVFL
ncbi:uncharacterized protein RCH25_043823 [Pelodytes ibericus]